MQAVEVLSPQTSDVQPAPKVSAGRQKVREEKTRELRAAANGDRISHLRTAEGASSLEVLRLHD